MPNSVAAKILAALERETDVNLHSSPINVKVEDVIRLEGDVDNIIIKRKAFRIARQAAGTDEIIDNLRLKVSNSRSNKELLNAAVDALMQEPAFANMDILTEEDDSPEHQRGWVKVSVSGKLVRLEGQVGSLSHRRLAEVIAWWVPGSSDIENLLHVYPAEDETDDEISDVVRMVFDKETSLDAEQIKISTRDSEVTLRGVVYSEEQKRIATYDCWYVPGVHAVHNELVVMQK